MKPLFSLVLAAALLPAATWAASDRPCNRLEDMALKLDRAIACQNRNGAGANVNDELERNFLLQLHQSAGCYDIKFAARVLNSRDNLKCRAERR